MSVVEFHVILGVSFMLGFIPRVSSALLKQNKTMQSNLSFEQRGLLTEMPKNLKSELGLILGVLGLHFFTVLFFEFPSQRVDSASAPVHIVVPLSFILMMGLLIYCIFRVNNIWKNS